MVVMAKQLYLIWLNLAIEDEFVEQGTVEELRKKLQLDADSICERILNFIK